MNEDISGLKSALEKQKEKVRVLRDENAALKDRIAQMESAFDFLNMATLLRNQGNG